jgi:hypothetical protein
MEDFREKIRGTKSSPSNGTNGAASAATEGGTHGQTHVSHAV